MILLSQAPEPLPDDGDDIVASTRAAAAAGWEVIPIPVDLDRRDPAEALASIPARAGATPAIWVGTIPSFATYEATYRALADRGIRLINDPEAHRTIFELDRAYPHLVGLTPRSVVVRSPDEVDGALAALGLPVFLKGALLSRKSFGWEACVARTQEDARVRVAALLRREYFSRGRVILRELVPLRAHRVPALDFPIGREFRVFLLDGEIAGFGYYWPYVSELAALTPEEEASLLDLARRAAARLPARLVSLDIGALEDGTWTVIESGDPQFSGLSFIAPGPLWRRLAAILGRE
ncbi:MAG: ATP-grasp domain-containing protein [Myxococcales bacterium]|nr:ATP-grasp domain-containing protein [Myxococcales bacterium]